MMNITGPILLDLVVEFRIDKKSPVGVPLPKQVVQLIKLKPLLDPGNWKRSYAEKWQLINNFTM